MMVLRYPTGFAPVVPLHQCPLPFRHWLSVGCCVPLANGSHLRPRPCPSLYFLMCLVCTPQISDPTPVSTNSKARALSILFWVAAAPRFGGTTALSMESAKPLDREVAAAHFDCCVCVCGSFCVWEQLLATILVESQHQPRQNGQLCTLIYHKICT